MYAPHERFLGSLRESLKIAGCSIAASSVERYHRKRILPFLRDADSKVVVATVKAASPCITAPGATAGTANQAGHPLSSPASLQPATCVTQMQQEPPARGSPADADTQMRDIPAEDGEGGAHGKQQADGTGPTAAGWCTQQL